MASLDGWGSDTGVSFMKCCNLSCMVFVKLWRFKKFIIDYFIYIVYKINFYYASFKAT